TAVKASHCFQSFAIRSVLPIKKLNNLLILARVKQSCHVNFYCFMADFQQIPMDVIAWFFLHRHEYHLLPVKLNQSPPKHSRNNACGMDRLQTSKPHPLGYELPALLDQWSTDNLRSPHLL